MRADVGDDTDSEEDIEEAREIEDVERWLTGEEVDLPLTTPPPPEKYIPDFASTQSNRPFNLFNAPAPFILQIIHAIFVYFNLLSQPLVQQPTRPMRREMVSLPPSINVLDTTLYVDGKRDSSVKYGWDTRQRCRAAYLEEDTEYVIHTIDEEVIRIPVTRDISHTKLRRHGKGMVRIYRIPDRDIHVFGSISRSFGLKGLGIRLPFDEFDNVALMRHGQHSWDFGRKDDHWMMMGTDAQMIRDLIQRTRKWAPPFRTRVRNYFTKFVRRLRGYRSTPIYFQGTPYSAQLDPLRCSSLSVSFWILLAHFIREYAPGNWKDFDWDWDDY